MQRILATAALILSLSHSNAQGVIDVNSSDGAETIDRSVASAITGQIYMGTKYVRVTEGTPFFKEKFMHAVLYDRAGARYRAAAVRLNLLDNEINFLGAGGKEMIASTPIHQVNLTDSTSGEKYYFVQGDAIGVADKTLDQAWFQVLVNDQTSLLVQLKKRIHEQPSYGTATHEQDIMTIEYYYLHKGGTLTAIKNWQDLQDQLKDQKPALDQFIKDHKLKGKNFADYTQLVTAYNAAAAKKS